MGDLILVSDGFWRLRRNPPGPWEARGAVYELAAHDPRQGPWWAGPMACMGCLGEFVAIIQRWVPRTGLECPICGRFAACEAPPRGGLDTDSPTR